MELTTEWIMLHGELEIGTDAKPRTATIVFTGNVKGEDIMSGNTGVPACGPDGGSLDSHKTDSSRSGRYEPPRSAPIS